MGCVLKWKIGKLKFVVKVKLRVVENGINVMGVEKSFSLELFLRY